MNRGFRSSSRLPALLMTASCGAASADAVDIHGADGAGTRPIQAGATVVAGRDRDRTVDLPAGFRVTPNMNLDADSVGPAPREAGAGSVDERSDDRDAEATAADDQSWVPLEHLGLMYHSLHTSGGDTVGGGAKVDTDVVDPLNTQWVMGSDLESHRADPLSARTDVDQYTFGLHINR
jgi:hypothetical protein